MRAMLSLLFFCCAFSAQAQSVTVEVTLQVPAYAETTIKIEGKVRGMSLQQTIASKDMEKHGSEVEFDNLSWGDYIVSVTSPGFFPSTRTLQLTRNNPSKELYFYLERTPIPPRPQKETNTSIGLCLKGLPAFSKAEEALDALSSKIKAMPPKSEAKDAKAELDSLLSTQCFLLARSDNARLPDGKSALVMQAWWQDGGEKWLRSYLSSYRSVIIPPDPKKLLTKESALDTSASSLLCSLDDTSCGVENEDIATSLNKFFEKYQDFDFPGRFRSKTQKELFELCEKEAKKLPASDQYSAWRDCLELSRGIAFVVPASRYQLPSEGWLLIEWVSGHHVAYLDYIAYNLETGAAYIATQSEWHRGTEKLSIGYVSLSALRQATLALLLQQEFQDKLQWTALEVPRPAWMVPQSNLLTPRDLTSTNSEGGLQTSGWHDFYWSWTDGTTVFAKGNLNEDMEGRPNAKLGFASQEIKAMFGGLRVNDLNKPVTKLPEKLRNQICPINRDCFVYKPPQKEDLPQEESRKQICSTRDNCFQPSEAKTSSNPTQRGKLQASFLSKLPGF